MHNYIDKLGLDFDPFVLNTAHGNKAFFAGAGRQQLLAELVDQTSRGGGLLSVTGALGAGKSCLASTLASDLGKDAVCVSIQATLFMSRSQFLEQIQQQLSLAIGDISSPAAVDAVCAFANDLALDARTLVLIIDDAHELASEVFNLLFTLLRRNSGGGFAAVLLGEAQLANLLQANLPESQRKQWHEYALQPLSSEDSFEYVRFKLANAGYRKPLPLSGGELAALHNAAGGLPGILNDKLAAALEMATTESDNDQGRSVRASLWALGQGYWAVAAGLGLVMLILLLLQPSPSPGESQSTAQRQITVATAAETDLAEPSLGPASDSPAVQPQAQPAAPTPAPDKPVATQVTQAAQQLAESRAPARQYRSFEQALLSYPADSYTIQVMAASSAEKIEQFLAETAGLDAAGFYETRYRGQPWFVVVTGNYGERATAQQAIGSLPRAVRELQPWIRSVADIQSSIRDLPR